MTSPYYFTLPALLFTVVTSEHVDRSEVGGGGHLTLCTVLFKTRDSLHDLPISRSAFTVILRYHFALASTPANFLLLLHGFNASDFTVLPLFYE